MPARRDPMPTLGALARRIARVERTHGPLGLSVPGTDWRADRWRGPVVRRDPRTYQRQTSVGILRCPYCSHWRDESPDVACSTCGIYSLSCSLT